MIDDTIPNPGEKDPGGGAPEIQAREPAASSHEAAAQQAAQQLQQFRERLGPDLSGLIERGVSGKDIVSYLREYQVLAQQPSVARALEVFRRTGEIQLTIDPVKSVPSDDAYLDDEQRELRSLHEELLSVKGALHEQASGSSMAAARAHFQGLAEKMGLEGEERDKALSAVTFQIENLAKSGDVGAPMLRALVKPEGEKTVEMIILHTLGVDGLRKVIERQEQRKSGRRRALATDLPGVGSPGSKGDGIPDFDGSLLEAFLWAQENPERLP